MLSTKSYRLKGSARGFTLLELLITLAVIGILASIALPSYSKYVLRSKRIEGKTSLMRLLHQQEKFRANCEQYGSTIAGADSCVAGSYALAAGNTSDTGLYTLAVTASDATSFTATATATGSQLKDAGCTVLTLAQSAGSVTTTPTSCW